MNKNIKYFPTNWKDGMKMTSQDLKNDQLAFFDWLRDGRQYNREKLFGLLPIDSTGQLENPVLDLQLTGSGAIIKILNCKAICKDGSRIEISTVKAEQNFESPSVNVEFGESSSFSLLIACKRELDEAGFPSEHSPPRYSYLQPKYELFLGPEETQTFQENTLKIAEIKITSNNIEIDPNYLPACCYLTANSLLINNVKDFVSKLREININLKSTFTRALKSRGSDYAKSTLIFTKDLFLYLSGSIKSLENAETPLQLFDFFQNLCNYITSLVEIINIEFEFFVAELIKHDDNRGHNILFLGKDVTGLEFNSNSIGLYVEKISQFMEALNNTSIFFERFEFSDSSFDVVSGRR